MMAQMMAEERVLQAAEAGSVGALEALRGTLEGEYACRVVLPRIAAALLEKAATERLALLPRHAEAEALHGRVWLTRFFLAGVETVRLSDECRPFNVWLALRRVQPLLRVSAQQSSADLILADIVAALPPGFVSFASECEVVYGIAPRAEAVCQGDTAFFSERAAPATAALPRYVSFVACVVRLRFDATLDAMVDFHLRDRLSFCPVELGLAHCGAAPFFALGLVARRGSARMLRRMLEYPGAFFLVSAYNVRAFFNTVLERGSLLPILEGTAAVREGTLLHYICRHRDDAWELLRVCCDVFWGDRPLFDRSILDAEGRTPREVLETRILTTHDARLRAELQRALFCVGA